MTDHSGQLGFGLGLRPQHYHGDPRRNPDRRRGRLVRDHLRELHGRRAAGRSPCSIAIRERYPVVMHGVSLSIGSTDPLDRDYLARPEGARRARRAALGVRPSVLDRRRRRNMHDLLPLPYTEEALAMSSRASPRSRTSSSGRSLLENVSTYVELRATRCRSGSSSPRWRGAPAAAPARRQQRLCQRVQPRLRRRTTTRRRSRPIASRSPPRRPQEQHGTPHHRHPRRSGARRRCGSSIAERCGASARSPTHDRARRQDSAAGRAAGRAAQARKVAAGRQTLGSRWRDGLQRTEQLFQDGLLGRSRRHPAAHGAWQCARRPRRRCSASIATPMGAAGRSAGQDFPA